MIVYYCSRWRIRHWGCFRLHRDFGSGRDCSSRTFCFVSVIFKSAAFFKKAVHSYRLTLRKKLVIYSPKRTTTSVRILTLPETRVSVRNRDITTKRSARRVRPISRDKSVYWRIRRCGARLVAEAAEIPDPLRTHEIPAGSPRRVCATEFAN